MRFLYFISKIIFQIPLWTYFRTIKRVNTSKKINNRTIFVSNHAASFMDPLVMGAMLNPSIFYMVRADVFKPFLLKIFNSLQMMPIYRQLDGGDTKAKNDAVFDKCNALLKRGRNILVFAEGFTDDLFIRRLKPLKKGAVRIGFGALEAMNWSEKLYMQTVGLNYSHPKYMLTDLLFEAGEIFCLNDYKDLYFENPAKAITEVTLRLEQNLKSNISHVEQENLAPLHELMMSITRKGLNYENFDSRISLQNRFNYSRQLAKYINVNKEENDIQNVLNKVDKYRVSCESHKLSDRQVYFKSKNKTSAAPEILTLLILSPLALLGLLHCFLPYTFLKSWVEKTFKRSVFWSSVKVGIGIPVFGFYNLIFAIALPYLFNFPGYFGFLYLILVVPICFIGWRMFVQKLNVVNEKKVIISKDLTNLVNERNALETVINQLELNSKY